MSTVLLISVLSVYSASTECLQCVYWVTTVRLLSDYSASTECLQSVYWVSTVRLLSDYEVTQTVAVSPANYHTLHICCLSTVFTQKTWNVKTKTYCLMGVTLGLAPLSEGDCWVEVLWKSVDRRFVKRVQWRFRPTFQILLWRWEGRRTIWRDRETGKCVQNCVLKIKKE